MLVCGVSPVFHKLLLLFLLLRARLWCHVVSSVPCSSLRLTWRRRLPVYSRTFLRAMLLPTVGYLLYRLLLVGCSMKQATLHAHTSEARREVTVCCWVRHRADTPPASARYFSGQRLCGVSLMWLQ